MKGAEENCKLQQQHRMQTQSRITEVNGMFGTTDRVGLGVGFNRTEQTEAAVLQPQPATFIPHSEIANVSDCLFFPHSSQRHLDELSNIDFLVFPGDLPVDQLQLLKIVLQ